MNIGLRVHIEGNTCGLGTMYECRNVLNLAPLYYDTYLDDMATQLHQILLWSIFISTVVHITGTGSYYGPLGKIFTYAFTLII